MKPDLGGLYRQLSLSRSLERAVALLWQAVQNKHTGAACAEVKKWT
jgi:hypothetical protein